MFLYLFRHGEANPKNEDPQRGLSDRGREEVTAVCRIFLNTNPQIDDIWHSGKTRAEQTAGLLAARCNMESHPRSGLDPNDPVQPLAQELGRRDSNLVIVGHLPQLSRLISTLLVGGEGDLLDLPAAGLVCLERNIDWQLAWFLIPELC